MLIKLIANELVEGDIDFVSLVKHGANRAPFKIVKALTFPDSGGSDGVTTTTNITSDTDWVALDKPVSIIDKNFSSFPESSDFNENIGAAAFFPGLHNAMEALAASTFNSLDKADSMDDAASQIDKNLMAFRKHVNALVKNLPATVLKEDKERLLSGIGSSTLEASETNTSGKEDSVMTGERIPEAMGGDLDGLNDTIEKDAAALAIADSQASVAVEAEAAVEKEGGTQTVTEPVEKETKTEAAGVNDPVVEETTDTGEVAAPMPKGFVETNLSIKQFVDGELVDVEARFAVNEETGEQVFLGYQETEKTSDGKGKKRKKDDPFNASTAGADEQNIPEAVVSNETPQSGNPFMEGLNLIGKEMNAQNSMLAKHGETLEKINTTLEKVVETNEEKIEKAENATLVQADFNLDESLATLNGHSPVVKTDADDNTGDIFKGLAPELEHLYDTAQKRNVQ